MVRPRMFAGSLLASRQWLKLLKVSASCAVCGEDDPYALDFHHTDPATKDFTISASPALKKTRREVLHELEKCETLCSNCHRKHHHVTQNVPSVENNLT